mgnify:CR=1 FL=1
MGRLASSKLYLSGIEIVELKGDDDPDKLQIVP